MIKNEEIHLKLPIISNEILGLIQGVQPILEKVYSLIRISSPWKNLVIQIRYIIIFQFILKKEVDEEENVEDKEEIVDENE